MEALRIVIQIIFILICIALAALVLMQEGKSAGLGAISGAAETYWGKNKGHSLIHIDHSLCNLIACNRSLFIQCHQAAQCQSVLSHIQRTNSV